MRLLQIAEKMSDDDPLLQTDEVRTVIAMYKDYYPKIGFLPPWTGYLISHEDKIVGTCGFTGAPDGNRVELAYWTFGEFEGQGIASFACAELVKIARENRPDIILTAKTAPEKNASNSILEKNAFQFDRVVQDEEIGDAWLWVLKP